MKRLKSYSQFLIESATKPELNNYLVTHEIALKSIDSKIAIHLTKSRSKVMAVYNTVYNSSTVNTSAPIGTLDILSNDSLTSTAEHCKYDFDFNSKELIILIPYQDFYLNYSVNSIMFKFDLKNLDYYNYSNGLLNLSFNKGKEIIVITT